MGRRTVSPTGHQELSPATYRTCSASRHHSEAVTITTLQPCHFVHGGRAPNGLAVRLGCVPASVNRIPLPWRRTGSAERSTDRGSLLKKSRPKAPLTLTEPRPSDAEVRKGLDGPAGRIRHPRRDTEDVFRQAHACCRKRRAERNQNLKMGWSAWCALKVARLSISVPSWARSVRQVSGRFRGRSELPHFPDAFRAVVKSSPPASFVGQVCPLALSLHFHSQASRGS